MRKVGIVPILFVFGLLGIVAYGLINGGTRPQAQAQLAPLSSSTPVRSPTPDILAITRSAHEMAKAANEAAAASLKLTENAEALRLQQAVGTATVQALQAQGALDRSLATITVAAAQTVASVMVLDAYSAATRTFSQTVVAAGVQNAAMVAKGQKIEEKSARGTTWSKTLEYGGVFLIAVITLAIGLMAWRVANTQKAERVMTTALAVITGNYSPVIEGEYRKQLPAPQVYKGKATPVLHESDFPTRDDVVEMLEIAMALKPPSLALHDIVDQWDGRGASSWRRVIQVMEQDGLVYKLNGAFQPKREGWGVEDLYHHYANYPPTPSGG